MTDHRRPASGSPAAVAWVESPLQLLGAAEYAVDPIRLALK